MVNIIIVAVIVILVVLASFSMAKRKKSGKSISCSGNCVGCPMAGKCHEQKE